MAQTHYEVLGVTITSTATEIRSAYRRIVLLHHPDRSADPKSKSIFLAATESYQVLSDESSRREYDARLQVEQQVRSKKVGPPPGAQPRPRPPGQQPPSARMMQIKEDVVRLSQFFSRGRYGEAEELARSIIERDPRQSVPYAVLGDIARLRGRRGEALKLYAYAVQFDPRNVTYQRRYEELLSAPVRPIGMTRPDKLEEKPQYFAGIVGIFLLVVAAAYIVLAREIPVLPGLKLISTWTVGLIVMLFFCGVVAGACLSIEGLLDSFSGLSTNALGRISPTLALASIAVVSFWLALLMYIILGLARQAYNYSTSRLVASSAAITCLLSLAAEASGTISGSQVALWGGNLVYIGALCGWMVSDALRTA